MIGSLVALDRMGPAPSPFRPVVTSSLLIGSAANIGSLTAFSVQTFRAAQVSGSRASEAWAWASLGMHLSGMAAMVIGLSYSARSSEQTLLPSAFLASAVLLVPAGYFTGVVALERTLKAVDQRAWSPLHRFLVHPIFWDDGGGVVLALHW